jgi:hypothetical protein
LNTIESTSFTVSLGAAMLPISGRIPDDLYEWLSTTSFADAATVSDKLRIAIATLRRLHDGASDYMGTLEMYRDLGRRSRERFAQLEREIAGHSEVLATLSEHLPALLAMLHASVPATVKDAKGLEQALVQRTFQLCETLLRQAATRDAAAYDPQVIQRNMNRLIELARILPSPTPKGE